jgi:hypothetical protein
MGVPKQTGEVASANRALSHIGIRSALPDLNQQNSKAARVLRNHFGHVRDRILRTYDLGFAKADEQLTPVNPSGLTGIFTKAWNWPETALRIVSVRPFTKRQWRTQENRRILTCATPAAPVAIFVRQVEDLAKWDDLAASMFEHELALAVAPELTHRRQSALDCERRLEGLRQKATLIDALEQDSVEDDYDADHYIPGYIAARYGWTQ